MLEVLFIGTGDAFGSGGRRNSAILVRDGPQTLLLDCGPTTLQGLRELGIDPREIDVIAISHYHGDHSAGTPFLLIDYLYEDRREKPLDIIGPPGIRGRTEELVRLFGYQSEIERGYDLRYHEFESGTALELSNFVITPSDAHHHPETYPYMLRVETDDRALLFSGDTGWTEELPNTVGDVNLFICECVFFDETFKYHMSHERLDRERARFRCDRIVLTHLGRQVLDGLDRVRFETADDGFKLKV